MFKAMHVHISRSIGAALAGLLLGAAAAVAQPSATATIGGSFDAFQAGEGGRESRQNVLAGVSADHLFGSGRSRISYDLDAGNYDSPGDWRYFQHDLGFSHRVGSEEAKGPKVFLVGSLTLRSNGDAWSGAAYTAAGAGANLELHPGESTTLRTGYRADYRRFADLDALTQFEQRGFVSLLSSLPSRTTIVAEVQAGLKQYRGLDTGAILDVGASAWPTAGRGNAPGMGPGIRWTYTPAAATSTLNGRAALVTALGRVAQSVTDRTGVHAQIIVRRTFGSIPPALVTTPAGFFEDGIYDDPFASDAVIAQAGVKRVFANSAEVAVTARWADKSYSSAVAIVTDASAETAEALRQDRVTLVTAAWTQPLFASRTGALSLSADLGYRLMRHRSNDIFYNYTSHAALAGITVGY